MKIVYRVRFSLILILLSTLAIAQQQVPSVPLGIANGGHETHGGDNGQGDFIHLARQAVVHIRRLQDQFPEISAEVLSAAIEQGPVPLPVPGPLACDGLTNAAACYNSRTRQIVFDQAQWLLATATQRIRDATHEYLRRAGANDDTYAISDRLTMLVPADQFENQLPQICPRSSPFCRFERQIPFSQFNGADLGITLQRRQSASVSARGEYQCDHLSQIYRFGRGRQWVGPHYIDVFSMGLATRFEVAIIDPVSGPQSAQQSITTVMIARNAPIANIPGENHIRALSVSAQALKMNILEQCNVHPLTPQNAPTFTAIVTVYNH